MSTSGLVRPWGAHILVPVGTRLEMGLPGQLMLWVLGGRVVRRGGKKYPGVFKYCIRGCQERCCVKSKGKEGKR